MWSWIISTNFPWEFIRNADPWTSPQIYWIRDSWGEALRSALWEALQVICTKIWEPLLWLRTPKKNGADQEEDRNMPKEKGQNKAKNCKKIQNSIRKLCKVISTFSLFIGVHFLLDTSSIGWEKTEYANITCSAQPSPLTYPTLLIEKLRNFLYWESCFLKAGS